MDDQYNDDSDLWYFSTDCYRIVTDTDRKRILTLSRSYSSELWEHYISKSGRHLMLLAHSEWPNEVKGKQQEIDPNPEIDDDQSQDIFADALARQLPYQPDDKIYFFWMKEWAVETTWAIFLRNWPHFFFEDEGPILIVPNYLTAIVFCLGKYTIVQRPSNLT